MSHEHSIGDPQELATLYVAGALTADEAAAFERHLHEGCPRCRVELHQLDAVVDDLCTSTALVTVDAALKQRVIHRIEGRVDPAAASRVGHLDAALAARKTSAAHGGGESLSALNAGESGSALDDGGIGSVPAQPNPQVWKRWQGDQAATDWFIRRRDEGAWEETGIAGIQVRRLFVDPSRNQMTALVRMAAGTAYPRHIHDGPEECLVLDGDLWAGDVEFHQGDYQRMTPGSRHDVQSTKEGCLLLIVSSLSDEIG